MEIVKKRRKLPLMPSHQEFIRENCKKLAIATIANKINRGVTTVRNYMAAEGLLIEAPRKEYDITKHLYTHCPITGFVVLHSNKRACKQY